MTTTTGPPVFWLRAYDIQRALHTVDPYLINQGENNVVKFNVFCHPQRPGPRGDN